MAENKGGLADQMSSLLPGADNDTRSTEEYLRDTKPINISSVPGFKRPMAASDNDQQIGEDESGNPVYRTALGGTYTVRLSSDQRTTRTKIQEDVLPAVTKYLADPTAPTADQAIAAAKAIAGDAWETISIPGDLLTGKKDSTDITMGEVFELVGGAGATSTVFDVPGGENTLRIFGGAKASNPPNMRDYDGIESSFEREADLETLMELGIDFETDPSGSMVRMMDEIERNPAPYQKTLQEIGLGQWFRGRDNLMRFEIDDSKSSVKNMDLITPMGKDDMDAYLSSFSFEGKFPDNSIQDMPGEKAFTTLEDVFNHRELYEKYPEIRNAPVIEDVEYFDNHPSTSGYFDPHNGIIALNPKMLTSPEELRSTLLHEIQHLVQHLEGFETGTSSYSGEVYQIKTALNDSPTAKKLMKDYEKDVKVFDAAMPKVYEQVADKNAEVARKVLDIALDKVEKDTGVAATDIIEGLSQNKLMSEIIREKTGKPLTDLYWNINSLFNVAEKSSKDFGSAFIGTKLGDKIADDSKYTDYLDYLSDEEKLDALDSIVRKSGFVIQEALKKYDESNGYFASEFLKSFGYPVEELKKQNFSSIGNGAINTARFYGIDVPEKPIRPEKFSSHTVYTLKRGEVESRLVSARKDIPGSKRSPENVFDQEDTPPQSQWGEPELKQVREGKDGYRRRPSTEEPRQFAEGGAVDTMDRQMELFAKGGLNDDGMDVDPVSGNEVPPGSLAKEVRDDIPAQLSEGEYVVPADIVRFYGVNFFENLRNKGKDGLDHMAETGRIGGEPVPAGGPKMAEGGDLTPEEMEEIRSLMNVGGMVQQPTADPYQQQSAMYQQPRAAAMGGDFGNANSFYTPGDIDATARAVSTPSQYTGEFSSETPTLSTRQSSVVTLYCPDGTSRSFPVPMSEVDRAAYDEMQQKGCNLDAKTMQQEPESGGGRDDGDDDRGSDTDPNAWMGRYDYNDPGALLKSSQEVLSGAGGVLGQIAGNIFGGGVLGAFIKGTNAAQIAANVRILEAMGAVDEAAALSKDLDKYKEDNGLNWIPPGLINGDQLAGDVIDSGVVKLPTSTPTTTPTEPTELDEPADDSKNKGDGSSVMDSMQAQMATAREKAAKAEAENRSPGTQATTYVPSAVDTKTGKTYSGRGSGTEYTAPTGTSNSSGKAASNSYKNQADEKTALLNKGGLIKRRKKK